MLIPSCFVVCLLQVFYNTCMFSQRFCLVWIQSSIYFLHWLWMQKIYHNMFFCILFFCLHLQCKYYLWTVLRCLQLCLCGLYLATCVSIFLKRKIYWMKYVEYYKLQNSCRINQQYWQYLKYSNWFPFKKNPSLHILNFSAKYQI